MIRKKMAEKLLESFEKTKPNILTLESQPGIIEDIILTALVRDVKTSYDDIFEINIITKYSELWENNPYIKTVNKENTNKIICNYNENFFRFSTCYKSMYNNFCKQTGINIEPTKQCGDLYLDKTCDNKINDLILKNDPYIIIDINDENGIKMWNYNKLQKVVNNLKHEFKFIQITYGKEIPSLDNVINIPFNLKNNLFLINNAEKVLVTPNITMHLANSLDKSGQCVVINGAYGNKYWDRYIRNKHIENFNNFECSKKNKKGCFVNDIKDCKTKIKIGDVIIPKCFNNITPDEVINKLNSIQSNKTPIENHKGILPEKHNQNKMKDKDWQKIRHGRERNVGYDLKEHRYLQPAPLFFTQDGHNLWLGDQYHNSSLFLICTGPSFGDLIKRKWNFMGEVFTTKELLDYPGHMTMGINNSVKTYRPNMWICIDPPGKFLKSIHVDPKIQKFMPLDHADKQLYDNDNKIKLDLTPSQCPNVIYFRRNELFNHERFLFEDTMNWGNNAKYHNEDEKYNGKRSVMLPAIRIAFQLGFRNVYLLGCDMHMDPNQPYHFKQDKSKGGANSNNKTYENMFTRFEKLKPIFEKNDFNIYNCNPDSALKVFPYKSFDQCILESTENVPNIKLEETDGMYDNAKKK